MTDIRQIGDIELFRGLTRQETEQALEALGQRERSYEKNELILRAGELTETAGVVLSGSVTVESNDVWGSRTVLSHVGRGEFFAETYAVVPGEALSVDVRANEPSRILFLRLGELVREDRQPEGSEALLRNLLMISARKNLLLSRRSFQTAPKSARGRIMAYLNAVAVGKHSMEFDIPFDRQQLADYLNLERTALSKELGRMAAEGLIRTRKNHFVLLREDPGPGGE